MRAYSILFLSIISLLFSCSEEDADTQLPIPDVYEIKNIGWLSTTEYTIGKIVKLDDPPEGWLEYGDRKLLISCKARVKAGVDLTEIKKEDIIIDGKNLSIKLPKAEITSFHMDPNDVNTRMESINGLRDKFTQTEKNDFMRQGEEAIRLDLESTEIYIDAEKNATLFLQEFYAQMGFDKVNVEYEKKDD